VFENMVVRRLIGYEREYVSEGWRKLHFEELHNFLSSPHVLEAVKSRNMRWSRHVASTRK
jgi:hypothetical protein